MRAPLGFLVLLLSVPLAAQDVPIPCCTSSGSMVHVALTNNGAAYVWSDNGLRAAVSNVLPIPLERQTVLSNGGYRDPAIASDGSDALVVWVENNALFFMPIGPDVNVISRQVAAFNVGLAAPAVAWNGSKYIVAWSHASNAVLSAGIDASGRYDGVVHVLQPGGAEVPKAIAIDSSGDDSFVVWDRFTYDLTCGVACQASLSSEVRGSIVDGDGAPRASAAMTVNPSGFDPRLAWNGREYFVIWTGFPNRGLFGRRFDRAGDTTLSALPLTVVAPPDHQARIAWNGSTYYVVWLHQVFSQDQVYYAQMDENGVLGTPLPFAGRLTSDFDIDAQDNGTVVLVRGSSAVIATPPAARFIEQRRRVIRR